MAALSRTSFAGVGGKKTLIANIEPFAVSPVPRKTRFVFP